MNNLGSRVVGALIAGIVAGLVTVLILFVISVLVPGLTIDSKFWGMIVGILVFLWQLFNGNSNTRL